MLRYAALLFALTGGLLAQADLASLNGTVKDSSQSVVAGARVEAVSRMSGMHRTAVTGNAGNFVIPALPIGIYTLTVSKAGFHAAEFKDVELTVGRTRTIDVELAVGAV